MEVAVIDWKNSKFVKDDTYEHINAPQWVDFSALNDDVSDEAWFCRSDCNHPKTVEDFMKKTPGDSKLQRSSTTCVSEMSDRNRRDGALKKRGPPKKDLRGDIYVGDTENHNPNLGTTTPPNYNKAKLMIKSSAEKQQQQALSFLSEEGEAPPPPPPPRLTSTLSARNLFAGKDILNQITEFCNELKRLATRKQKEETRGGGEVEIITGKEESQVGGAKKYDRFSGDNSGVFKVNERKPLLEGAKKERKCGEEEESSAYKSSNATKEKLSRKKRNDDAENSPILSVNLKVREERVLQIRTNPPSPQCFSANPPKKVRGILQELEPSSKEEEAKKGVTPSRAARNATTSAVAAAEKDARALDVFWFLKPCTLASN